MTETAQTLRLANGRRLGLLRFGAERGEPFFYFHGMPGSRYESLLIRRQALDLGLSIVSLDRPGYGLSDACPGRSLLDWSEDVIAVADQLGLQRFGVIGVSGGGPYALACASAIPERLSSVAVVCGLGPVFQKFLLNDMPGFGRTAFRLEEAFPRAFRTLYGLPLTALSKTAPAFAVYMLAWHCGGVDRRVLSRTDVRNGIAASLPEAFRQGARASARDIHLYQQPWGFSLAGIGMEIHFWHGTADPIVPASHSEYVAGCLPNARLSLVPGAGHFSLPVLHAEEILRDLKSRV